jgi:sulfhydrogenase subunit beta (sulfur reductase)
MKKTRIEKDDLKALFETLSERYRVIGPKAAGGAVVLSEISCDDIPAGYRDRHGPGHYRIEEAIDGEVFSFSPGPDSLKKFLHPPSGEVFSFMKTSRGLTVEVAVKEERPMAFVGVRACDLAALELLDKVFLEGPVTERRYDGRRRDIFIVAVNCLRPGENCFCVSMGTGPEAKRGYDLAMTEIPGAFIVEAGSPEGERVIEKIPCREMREGDIERKNAALAGCAESMRKSMKTSDLPGILYRNMEHPRWAEIAEVDLECGNCTMVCPTCFCNSSYDLLSVSTLSGNLREFSGVRRRTWDSCFSKNFARVHGGNFRPSRQARYRHWMTHKLAYWIDQFGRPGCVGCGRCITWCPVGIDITHELEELRRAR